MGKEKRKKRKSSSEEKVVGFSSAFLFPARNGRQGGTGRKPREVVSSKTRKPSETVGAFQIHSRKNKNNTSAGSLAPNN